MGDKTENNDGGAMWFNTNRHSLSSPDLSGICTVNGEERRIAAWFIADDQGVKLSFTVYDPRQLDKKDGDDDDVDRNK